MKLKSEYFKQIRDALLGAFNLASLQSMVRTELDLDLDDIAAQNATKPEKIEALISWAEERDRVEALITGAREVNPTNKKLETAEEELLGSGKDVYILSDDIPPIMEDAFGDTYTDAKTGLEMIRIPAGEFIYGEDNRLDYLPTFWISKTPVTNAQYLRFVRTTGNDPPKHWKGIGPKAELLNHPIVMINWDDAKAYAGWAGMDLPTEQEWEKAARGTDGHIYPWGNEWHDGYCNTEEAGIGTTTQVGQYSPQGDSSYGCVDMVGNVWEWTSSWYDDKKIRRVLRGGSWYYAWVNARAAFRYFVNPDDLYHSLSFRLVRRPASVSAAPIEAGLKAINQDRSDSQYYSCFISYSSKDAEFTEKLRDDLQIAGVECWFAPEDMKIGQRVRDALDSAVMGHHKLLLILSKDSTTSDWVEQEVETAFEKERDSGETVLFPVRLDNSIFGLKVGWASHIKRTRHIGDFRKWKNTESYQKTLERVLRDLNVESGDEHG